jgi:threonine/homoserine/homoserine lactone efflux protein
MLINQHLMVLYLVTVALLMVAPGPDMLFVLGTGMRGGPRVGFLAACGVASSEAVHITMAAAGLAALFAAVPAAFTTMRIAGAAYLFVLGIKALRARATDPQDTQGTAGMTARRAYLRGALTNLLNPKMVTFTIALLPQFIDRGIGHIGVQFAILGAVFLAFELFVDGTVGILAGRIGRWLAARRRARRGLNVATGSLFIGLSVRLASER